MTEDETVTAQQQIETQEPEVTAGLSLPIELPTPEKALETFTDTEKLRPYLDAIAERARSLVPDLSTAKGRKAIASNAANVAKSKTALDAVGKDLVDEYKEIPKKIDAGRKLARDFLDGLKDEVRKPLTEWEAAEEKRVKAHQAKIGSIKAAANNIDGLTSARLSALLASLAAEEIGPQWEEFEGEAAAALVITQKTLRDALAKREAFEAEQAALEKQRQEQEAERQRLERVRIEQEAADKARKEAEDANKAKEEEARQRELKARMAQENAERETREAKEATEKAKADAAAQAEKAAQDAEARVKREAEEAAAKEAAENKRRQEDLEHRATINREALADLMALELDEATAKRVLIGIIQGKVANVGIRY